MVEGERGTCTVKIFDQTLSLHAIISNCDLCDINWDIKVPCAKIMRALSDQILRRTWVFYRLFLFFKKKEKNHKREIRLNHFQSRRELKKSICVYSLFLCLLSCMFDAVFMLILVQSVQNGQFEQTIRWKKKTNFKNKNQNEINQVQWKTKHTIRIQVRCHRLFVECYENEQFNTRIANDNGTKNRLRVIRIHWPHATECWKPGSYKRQTNKQTHSNTEICRQHFFLFL